MDVPPGPLPAGQGRAALLAEVTRALGVLSLRDTVVVACSGGPDSSALAHLVAEARPDLDLRLVHVRHGLRDDRQDVEVVTTHAQWLALDLTISDVEVVRDGRGTEAAARDARYAALRDAARTCGASAVLVAHTADDQAETVLLRLARGTGIDGLAAMEPVRDGIVRPLLRTRREDVHRFVELEGLPTVEDPTNRDPQVRRAIVRHELLPVLARVAPDPIGSLARLADLARADAAALDQAAAAAIAEVVRVGPVRAIADQRLDALSTGPGAPALARRVVRAVLGELGGEAPDAATVSRVLALPDGSAASLPGPIEVTSAGGWRAFAPRSLPRSQPVVVGSKGRTGWSPAGIAIDRLCPDHLDVSGRQTALPLPGVWAPPPADRVPSARAPGATVAWLVLALPDDIGDLTLRHRAPGDQVRTAGGTRNLQDVLVDAGVPRAVREIWPVVTGADGRVVWSPGYAADDEVLRAGRGSAATQLRIVAG
jgi:tRNA(Ile)-lysidine synthase